LLGFEPGPSTDGLSPDRQGAGRLVRARPGPVLSLVDSTASPHCRCGAGRRAGYLPACKGSVDLRLPGHALARNWRQPVR
jgi:hypothetical protein